MDVYHRRVLERCFGEGRRWIVAFDVVVSAAATGVTLLELGASDVFVVAGSRGTGTVPDHIPAITLGTGGATAMEAIRATERAFANLSPSVVAALDRFDPDRTARVITSHFSTLGAVAGRDVFGARSSQWQALEDKTTVDAVWRGAGVPVAPSTIVEARLRSLREAASRLDQGQGTVWVADNRRGWHGGAESLRWVRAADHVGQAATFFAEAAHRVRVMPFLEGIPCSIHGVVLPDTTIAFRPCEMVVLRRPDRLKLFYAGMGTTWDPTVDDRETMRAVARRVGDHLRRAVGYRGVFTVDGVLTRDGFFPTELNPRCGAAAIMLASTADLPLFLLHLAMAEGVDVPWRPAALERQVIDAADGTRTVRSFATVPRPLPEQDVALCWDGDHLVEASDQAPDVRLTTGPSPIGGGVRVAPDVARHPPGQSIASVIAASLAYADRRWDLDIGPLEPARNVR